MSWRGEVASDFQSPTRGRRDGQERSRREKGRGGNEGRGSERRRQRAPVDTNWRKEPAPMPDSIEDSPQKREIKTPFPQSPGTTSAKDIARALAAFCHASADGTHLQSGQIEETLAIALQQIHSGKDSQIIEELFTVLIDCFTNSDVAPFIMSWKDKIIEALTRHIEQTSLRASVKGLKLLSYVTYAHGQSVETRLKHRCYEVLLRRLRLSNASPLSRATEGADNFESEGWRLGMESLGSLLMNNQGAIEGRTVATCLEFLLDCAWSLTEALQRRDGQRPKKVLRRLGSCLRTLNFAIAGLDEAAKGLSPHAKACGRVAEGVLSLDEAKCWRRTEKGSDSESAGVSTAPSDADGQRGIGRDRSQYEKCTVNALLVLQAVAKSNPKLLYSRWQAFFPERNARVRRAGMPSIPCLLFEERSAKVRATACATITSILDKSRPYLLAVEFSSSRRGASSFMPMSTRLGLMINELIHVLLTSIAQERDPTVLCQVYRAISCIMTELPPGKLPSEVLEKVTSAITSKVQSLITSADVGDEDKLIGGSRVEMIKRQRRALKIAEDDISSLSAAMAALAIVVSSTQQSDSLISILKSPKIVAIHSYVAPTDFMSIFLFRIWRTLFSVGKGAAAVRAEAWTLIGRLVKHYHEHILTGPATFLFGTIFSEGAIDIDSTVQLRVAKSISDYADALASSLTKVMPEDVIRRRGGDIFGGEEEHHEEGLIERIALGHSSLPQSPLPSSADPGAETVNEVVRAWDILLSTAVPGLLRSSSPAVRSTAIGVVGQLPSVLLDSSTPSQVPLAKYREAVCKIVFDGVKDRAGAVRTSALKAMGVLVRSAWAQKNPSGLAPVAAIVRRFARDGNSGGSVKEKAYWTLANLTDSLVLIKSGNMLHELSSGGPSETGEIAFEGLLANEGEWFRQFAHAEREEQPSKAQVLSTLVRESFYIARKGLALEARIASQAARAIGNLFRSPLLVKDIGIEELSRGVKALLSSLTTQRKNPKCIWNIAHAFSLLLKHCEFPLPPSEWSPDLIEVMVDELSHNQNFKVRIHAADVLSSIPRRAHLALNSETGVSLLPRVLESLFRCMDSGRSGALEFDVTQSKYLEQLQEQGRKALAKIIELVDGPDVAQCTQALHPHVVLAFIRAELQMQTVYDSEAAENATITSLLPLFVISQPIIQQDTSLGNEEGDKSPKLELTESSQNTLRKLAYLMKSAGHSEAAQQLLQLLSSANQ